MINELSAFEPLKFYCILIECFTETLKEFKAYVLEDNEDTRNIKVLRAKVNEFASKYIMPGIDDR